MTQSCAAGVSVSNIQSDCIWLLVATVCSNESTLSQLPGAKRLQMIVGNLEEQSKAQQGTQYPNTGWPVWCCR